MQLLSVIAVSLAVQAGPQPDPVTLIPEIIDLAIQESVWANDGYPAERPVALRFSSFLKAFAKLGRESHLKMADIVHAVRDHNREVIFSESKPWCASTKCDEIGEGKPVILVEIGDLQAIDGGYRLRMGYREPSPGSEQQLSSAGDGFGVGFLWDGSEWTHRLVGRVIRS